VAASCFPLRLRSIESLPHGGGEGWSAEICRRVRVPRRDFRHCSVWPDDDWHTQFHRLQDRQAESLEVGWEDDEACAGKKQPKGFLGQEPVGRDLALQPSSGSHRLERSARLVVQADHMEVRRTDAPGPEFVPGVENGLRALVGRMSECQSMTGRGPPVPAVDVIGTVRYNRYRVSRHAGMQPQEVVPRAFRYADRRVGPCVRSRVGEPTPRPLDGGELPWQQFVA